WPHVTYVARSPRGLHTARMGILPACLLMEPLVEGKCRPQDIIVARGRAAARQATSCPHGEVKQLHALPNNKHVGSMPMLQRAHDGQYMGLL
ncbi:hypothetical protein Dimus_010952, partial [Dionaea muscipula]